MSSLVESEICFRRVAALEGTLEVKPLVVLLLCINAAVAADHSVSEPWVALGGAERLLPSHPLQFVPEGLLKSLLWGDTPPATCEGGGFFSDRQELLGREVSAEPAPI